MRSGARVDGMVNTCEPLINVVNGNKPKVLKGAQKRPQAWAKRQVARCKSFGLSYRRRRATGE